MTVVRSEDFAGLAPSEDEKAAVTSFASDIARDMKVLMQQELQLAKAEITSEVSKVGKGAGMLGGAGFAGLMSVIFLSTAAWWGLSNLMDQSWAALIVAAGWALIGLLLFVVGKKTLSSISLKPERTLNSLKKIPGALKGQRGETS